MAWERHAASVASGKRQLEGSWALRGAPHMPVRLDECAIVMSGRVSASPGRMEVS